MRHPTDGNAIAVDAQAQAQTARDDEATLSEAARVMQKRVGSTPFPEGLQSIADDAHVLIARQAFRISDLEKQERNSRGYRVGHIAGFYAGIRAAAEEFQVYALANEPANVADAADAILALIQLKTEGGV